MRPAFAALGYTLIFGAVVGGIWLRSPPPSKSFEGISTRKTAPTVVAIEQNGDLRRSVAFWSRR